MCVCLFVYIYTYYNIHLTFVYRKIRSCLPSRLTKIIKIHREDLPSFQQLSKIETIYSQPSYPKLYPNTVYPEYAMAMHAKYDAMKIACSADFFKTSYFTWLDLGYFRLLDNANGGFYKLAIPEGFDEEKVAFSQAWPFYSFLSVKKVMLEKRVWVSGGMVLATKKVGTF